MPELILIRHANSQQDASVPASQWRLSQVGRAACVGLAERLGAYGLDRIISSLEPKAIETAQLAARQMAIPSEIAHGLHEHDRGNVPFLSSQVAFEAQVEAMFAQPDELVFGRETANQAHDRFQAAVAALVDAYPDESLGIVAHGTVISLLVARANQRDQVEFWRSLPMAGFVVVVRHNFELIDVVSPPKE